MIETLYYNGNIICVDSGQPKASGLIVRDDRVSFVGSSDEARRRASEDAVQVDLSGKTLIPGFNDNHLHVAETGDTASSLRLDGLNGSQIVASLKEKYHGAAPGQLLMASGWDYPSCPTPHKDLLDDAFPDNPVILSQYGGHGLWANSLALSKLRYRRKSNDPSGGQIMRDESGDLTGVVREPGAKLYLIRHYMKSMLSRRVLKASYTAAFHRLRSAGITTAQDNTWVHTKMRVLNALQKEGSVTCRLSCWFFGRMPPPFGFLMKRSRFDELWYHRGVWKYFLDGTFTTRTAWLTEPYADEPANSGKGKDTKYISRILIRNARKKRQSAFHAIGDRTIKEFLDAAETVGRKYSLKILRVRLEHAQLIRAEDIPRLRDNHILIASQPSALLTPDKDEALLGAERALRAYPYRSLLDAGVHLSFGSDSPGESILEPLRIIHLAVNRKGPEAITPLEALRCYTIESAFAEGREAEKGSISIGKLADFAILSDDLTTVPKEEIQNIRVENCIVGGRFV